MENNSPGVALTNNLRIGKVLLFSALIAAVAKGLGYLPDALVRLPEEAFIPFASGINALFHFMSVDMGLMTVTRGFARAIEWCLDVSANLLYGKNRWPHLGPLPWTVVAASAFMLGYALKGWRLGLLCGGTFVWIAVIGQWKWAMETLSVIIIATPCAVLLGLVLGVCAWRYRWIEVLLNPLLNIAQSLPHFSYMIPVVVFIGVGPKAGAIVTIIFATPPMIRMTLLGLNKVPPEVMESARMCGASAWQSLRYARIPTARNDILIGVNQVIMQCLAMVVLASFIGMPGLGQKLLQLLQALKIGRSVEIGITIVLLAILLDRCSRAWVEYQATHYERGIKWWKRHRNWLLWAGLVAVMSVLSLLWDEAHAIKRSQAITFSGELDMMVDWLVGILDPFTYAMRGILINYFLVPWRDAYLWMPLLSVLLLVAGIGWSIGALRSALVCLAFVGLIALSGWWDRAMITTYMVTVAVFIATIIGMPLGIWASMREKRAQRTLLLCDTAQTFPSFIYLIPVIMLFGVNDVAAIGAVIIYGIVPITRYVIEGIRNVPVSLTEAADMAGTTTWQKLRHVQLPVAVPIIMVGLNQTVMFSLFMVVIAAFIGTQDLGQEMQRALSSTDVGKGLVLGLCVAFLGLMVDHLIMRWAAKKKRALDLS